MDNRIKLFPDKNKKNKNKKDTLQKIRRKRNTNPSYIDIIHHLHQAVGNQEVQRMFETGEIQAKLKISSPMDEYEKEAERIAREVLNNFTSDEEEKIKISRKNPASSLNKRVASSNIDSSIMGLKGKGTPLQQSLRHFFEERFGYDFNDVRIHTDANAAELAESINAKAFTHSNDIVFGENQYQPGTTEGKKLIAHELAHTIQQNDGLRQDVVQRKEGNINQIVRIEIGNHLSEGDGIWVVVEASNTLSDPVFVDDLPKSNTINRKIIYDIDNSNINADEICNNYGFRYIANMGWEKDTSNLGGELFKLRFCPPKT